MKRVKLDRIDLKIMRHLQEDGRMTNADLAKKAGLSAPPCLRRTRSLEEAGYIKGYHAEIAAERMGYGTTVYALVTLNNHGESDLAAFEKHTQNWQQVRECYMLAGEADYMIKVVAENMEGYQKFVTSQLLATPNVTNVKSLIVMRRGKCEAGIPINDAMLYNQRR